MNEAIEQAKKDLAEKTEQAEAVAKEQRHARTSFGRRETDTPPATGINVFENLSSVDISAQTQQKGKFTYLSWSNAVREVLKRYPLASWQIREWGDIPYLITPAGSFVEVTATVEGISRTAKLPILNYSNQPVLEPNANEVNKAQLRCLTKAFALHGLGLNLWAGEDLQENERKESEQPITVNKYNKIMDLIESLKVDQIAFLEYLGASNFESLNTKQYAKAMWALDKKQGKK